MDRICQNPGCGESLEGLRADAITCSPACRTARSRLVKDGVIPVVVGPALAFTVPADWLERSARFWQGIDELDRPAMSRRA